MIQRRGRFVRAEALIVAGTGRGHPQNIRMAVHRLDDAGKHQKELQVIVRRRAGVEEILARVAAE